MDFVHLHVHTEFSLLDGAARIKELVKKNKELGMNSLAITDHGSMYGIIDFYRECRKQGVKPILGCEVYITEDIAVQDRTKTSHLILLAKNNTGYKNLIKLCSIGFLDGFYYKPRIDYDTLKNHCEGLVCLSACLAGELPQLVFKEDYEGAKKHIERMKEMFGDDYYIELQDHGIPQEKVVAPRLVKMAEETGTPMVVTNDVHYINRDDARAQDILLCIQTKSYYDDADRMRMNSDQMFLKSPGEMETLFPHIPSAMENTVKIAEACNVEIDFETKHLPEFPLPDGVSALEYLTEQTRKGMDRLGLSGQEEYEKRLAFELEVIKSMGFVDYFLIVWDYVRFAKENGIAVGPGRGSAAGSLCSYALDITTVDPIKFNLVFERFLNPERVSMPDIDIDFCTIRRGEVKDYVINKYGEDKVAQIITFNTMAPKACIKGVARVMKYPFDKANTLSKMIPNEKDITIDKALQVNRELKALYDAEEEVKNIIDLSLKLEGMPSHVGTHAAGVVISKSPLIEVMPVQKNEGLITTQFPMGEIENLGLLKMDFLGLRNLNVLQDTIAIIKESRGIDLDITNIPFDDKEVYHMISKGDTDGVFQLESRGMQAFLKELKPSSFEDIIAGISLFRPGPMDQIPTYVACKFNPDKVSYLHPKLEPILNMTYGCMVYQEQVMQIVRDLAGYSFGRSDLVRRAMAKKKQSVMDKERAIFIYGDEKEGIVGAVNNGVDEKSANAIFDQMSVFAEYAFNRSHAAAYGVISYQTAYLKCHYPTEMYAATINSYKGENEKSSKYIEDCRNAGIKVVHPNINISYCDFSVKDSALVFGLVIIKNVGSEAAKSIVREREENGKFKSFYDFCKRCGKTVNKRMVESLILAGCFDEFGHTRNSLLGCYETILDNVCKSGALVGQMSLFDVKGFEDEYEIPPKEEMDTEHLLALEKEKTGVYLSGHPLEKYKTHLKGMSTTISAIKEGEVDSDSFATIGGIITAKRNKITKRNDTMAYIELEDLTGKINVIAFPGTLQKYSSVLTVGNVVEMHGRINSETRGNGEDEREEFSFVPDSVKLIQLRRTLQIKTDGINREFEASIPRGNDVVEIYANVDGEWKKSVKTGALVSDDLIERATALFGEKNIRIQQ